MADRVEKIRYEVDAGKANQEIAGLEKSMSKAFETSAIKLAVLNKALDLAGNAIGAMSSALQQGIKDAFENERTTIRLSAALTAHGLSVDNNIRVLNNQSDELERMTGISDEVIRKLQGMSIQYGVGVDRIKPLITASVALAQTMDGDVNAAFQQLMLSMEGQARGSLKLIPGIGELTEAQLRSGKAIDLVNTHLGEFVDLATRGTSGAIVSATTAWNNMAEAVGKASLNMIGGVSTLKAITQAATGFSMLVEEGGLANALGAIFVSQEDLEKKFRSITGRRHAEAAAAEATVARESRVRRALEGPVLEAIPGSMAKDAAAADRAQAEALAEAKARAAASDRAFLEAQRQREEQIERENEAELGYQKNAWDRLMAATDEEVRINKEAQDEITKIREEAAKEQERIQRESMINLSDLAMQGFGTLLSASTETLADMVANAEFSTERMAELFFGMIGRQLIAQGQQHIMMGIGKQLELSLLGGPALVALGVGEIAAGMGMTAISGHNARAQAPPGAPGSGAGAGAGGGGRGGSRGGAGDFMGGYSSGDGGRGGRSSAPVITVVVEGWMSPEEAGRRTKQAIEEANRSGL